MQFLTLSFFFPWAEDGDDGLPLVRCAILLYSETSV